MYRSVYRRVQIFVCARTCVHIRMRADRWCWRTGGRGWCGLWVRHSLPRASGWVSSSMSRTRAATMAPSRASGPCACMRVFVRTCMHSQSPYVQAAPRCEGEQVVFAHACASTCKHATHRYFKCEEGQGVFVSADSLVGDPHSAATSPSPDTGLMAGVRPIGTVVALGPDYPHRTQGHPAL